MKREDLIDSLEYIDEELLTEADQARREGDPAGDAGKITPMPRKRVSASRWGMLAASLAVFLLAGVVFTRTMQFRSADMQSAQKSDTAAAEDSHEKLPASVMTESAAEEEYENDVVDAAAYAADEESVSAQEEYKADAETDAAAEDTIQPEMEAAAAEEYAAEEPETALENNAPAGSEEAVLENAAPAEPDLTPAPGYAPVEMEAADAAEDASAETEAVDAAADASTGEADSFAAAGTGSEDGKSRDGEKIAAASKEKMEIRVTSDAGEVVFALNDTPAARSLAAQLPITVDTELYGSNEIVFHPAEPLDTENGLEGGGTAGYLGYFAPWDNVVMYYGDFEEYTGLYILGEAVSGSDLIKDIRGRIVIEGM